MDNIELKIEKNIYEGVGLSHYEGRAVFIEGAIKDEIVEAKIVSKNHNYLRASIVNFIKKSDKRITPKCPYANICGSCDMPYIEYDYLCKLKKEMLNEIFQNFENLEFKNFVKSPEKYNYRRKVQYPVSETKKSKRILMGYFKEKTHEIINIKYCPIQPSIIDDIASYIRENWKLSGHIEKTHKGLLRHVNFRISTNSDILLTFVLNSDKFNNLEVQDFIAGLTDKFKQIKGIFINLNPDKTNKIIGDKTVLIWGQNFILEKLEDKTYKISSNSFFQVNPKCAELLFSEAKKLINKKGSFLDLYGGVGTIGIFMKDVVSKITLIEENKEAITLAKENYKLNNVQTYEVFEGSANKTIKTFIKEKRFFENILIDPPRKGSDIETLENISKMTNSIIYISCNPMTLKRDALILKNLGFSFKSIQGVDMFPFTHHIECIAYFRREN